MNPEFCMKNQSDTITSLFNLGDRRFLGMLLCIALCPLLAQANNPSNPSNPDPNEKSCEELASGNECVNFVTSFPILPLEEEIGNQFTPQGLTYTSKVTTFVSAITEQSDLPVGVSHQFDITNGNNEPVTYQVPTGSTVGRVVGAFSGNASKVALLDENLEPTSAVPAYYRLFPGDGSYIDYPATPKRLPVAMRTATGRLIDLVTDENSAFDIVLGDGFYRQIRSAMGLADIVSVDEFGYQIRFYTVANTGSKVNGAYEPMNSPYRVIEVENPTGDVDRHDIIRITDTHGSYSQILEWAYVEGADDWELVKGMDPSDPQIGVGLVAEQKLVAIDSATKDRIITTESRNADGELISRKQVTEREFDWGRGGYIEEIQDVGGFGLTITREYYTDASETGRYGNKQHETSPDGSWKSYDYDSEGRMIQLLEPWQDSVLGSTPAEAKETTYDFSSVDPLDIPDSNDSRARTTIVRVLGVETGRSYNAYYTDAATGEYTEIEERTTVQGAAYGDATSLRTMTTYYAETASAVSAGRIKSKTTADGVVMAYSYAQADASSNFIETVDRLGSSGAVALKSTREVTTSDSRGNMIKQESYVYDGSAWQLYSRIEQDYSDELSSKGGQLTQMRKNGRIMLDQSWYGPLLGARTDETGIAYIYSYDLLDRLQMEIKLGVDGAEDIITTYDRDLGALDCGCDGSRSVERTAGGITLSSIAKTDSAGRPSERTDQNGYTTTFTYVDDRRVTTETLPSGATRITENYLDGRIKSITGTGVIPEYYDYTVNADGSLNTRVEVSSEGAPRYREMTYDVAGRLIREESPAYTGGAFVRSMEYNAEGLLSKQIESGRAATLFEYDALAQLVRSGLDLENAGASDKLELDSADRITDTTRQMELIEGDWFEVRSTTVYPHSDPASRVNGIQVSENRVRLSGFEVDPVLGHLASETISIDIRGNETHQRRYIHDATATVTSLTDTPGSSNSAYVFTDESGDPVVDGRSWDMRSVSTNGLLLEANSPTAIEPVIYGYDAIERRISAKDPRHEQASQTTYYTDRTQIFEQLDAAGNVTAFTYVPQGSAGAGQIASVIDAKLQKSFRAYDLLDRQIQTWGETDYPQAYGYNAYGELDTLTTWRDTAIDFSTATWPNPTGGDVTTWSYQPSTGLLTRKEYADGNGTDYSYDAANRLHVRTWARDGGLDTTYAYDPLTGELLNVNYEAADTADISYSFDRLGRQSTVTDATGTRSFVYDPATLQLTSEQLDASFYADHSLTRSTDVLGRSTGYSLMDGGQSSVIAATYGYDATSRLQIVTDGIDTFTYGYEANSNLLASLTAPQHTVDYSYETNRDVMIAIDNKLSGTSYSKYAYTYDELGRRSDRTQSGTALTAYTDTFAYNSRSEVEGSTNDDADLSTDPRFNPAYTYDQIGNRKSSTGVSPVPSYVSNELNQYVDPVTLDSPYVEDGNLETNGTWTYSWNNENRLKSATNGTTTIDFLYDYQGRLVEKDDGTNVEVYVYDGWNRIATFNSQVSSLSLHTSCLWGLDLSGSMQGAGGVGGLLKESEFDSNSQLLTSRCCLYDANGNITQKIDGTGTEVMNVAYDPFGNVISGTLVGEYGFSTKPLVEGIDWYYYGFRYYDPVTGRWPSRDPIEERGGVNVYAMVGNDPVSWIDLLGGRRVRTDSYHRKQKWYVKVMKQGYKCRCKEEEDEDGCVTYVCAYEKSLGEVQVGGKKLSKWKDSLKNEMYRETLWSAANNGVSSSLPSGKVSNPGTNPIWETQPYMVIQSVMRQGSKDPLAGLPGRSSWRPCNKSNWGVRATDYWTEDAGATDTGFKFSHSF
jgi:RHS repeat-associated protein